MLLESNPWLSIIPPIAAIAIAIKFRQVYIALIIGIWSGASILANGNIFHGILNTIERCVEVFANAGNTRVILFSAFIGAIISYTQKSGGMNGFIELVSRLNLITTRRRAQFLTVAIGASIPIESSINVLVTGTVSRPIFDRLKISREKLAYLCDSISAPICTLIPVNAWGAYASGLLGNEGIEKPFLVYLAAIPMNFYAIAAIGIVIFLIATQKDFFAMAKAEKRAIEEGKVLRDGATPLISTDVISIAPKEGVKGKASYMILPIATMIVMMIAGMLYTGNGSIVEGEGSKSVLWAVMAAILVAGIHYKIDGIFTFNELTDLFFKGVGGLIPIAILMMFAFAIGSLCNDLGTGPYVSQVAAGIISPKFIPVILFLITGFIAFSTGTSWGTWGIMFPIGIGTAQGMGLDPLPVIAAMMSGGVFGDHCSPISDTTLVSSMASASDHIDHVNTQLPYALTAGAIAAVLFIITGLILY
ncbi:Na+/H+ antiporter NhaC family protein [candidate division KSB1 bacterium]